jgi:hypothetical protein
MHKEDISIIDNTWYELYGEDMRSEYPGFIEKLEELIK